MKIIREYYDANSDEFTKANLEDTRRVRLTLRHLNKLRKMREMKDLENQVHRERLQKIYSNDQQESDLGI